MTAKENLYYLLEQFLKGKYDTENFCGEFETVFNFETERKDLSEKEFNVFNELFDKVVWYSPFPEDRAVYPGYLDEKKIHEAAENAAKSLDIKT